MAKRAGRRVVLKMTQMISRRKAFAAVMGGLASGTMLAQSLPVRPVKDDYKEDLFYREDWLGEPWRKPDPVVLIHGDFESSVEWYAWVPRMAQEYRLIRPDLPGLGHSNIPPGFEFTLANLAKFVTRVMDKAGVDAAHIVGAKASGAVAMKFAADFPKRTRSLVVVSGLASSLTATPLPVQGDRLGSHASKEMVAYWNSLFERANREGTEGLKNSVSNFDFAKEGVLQRITAPTLVITADRGNTLERTRAWQKQIPNSRLVVIQSDAYHIAAANAEECLDHTMKFLKELKS
jgi:pimeloyl-ACP methyl ester carboxylesterase